MGAEAETRTGAGGRKHGTWRTPTQEAVVQVGLDSVSRWEVEEVDGRLK
jgi:hypothetical protein